MTKRTTYEMSEEQFQHLLDACKPVPYLALQCGEPPSPQERANDAWVELGREMGFKPMSVLVCPGKMERFFTAEPVEPDQPLREMSRREGEAIELEERRAQEHDSAEDSLRRRPL